MTTNLKQNATNISQPQGIINNPSLNSKEIENPTFPVTHETASLSIDITFPVTHNNACSFHTPISINTHNNTLSATANNSIPNHKNASSNVTYHTYVLGSYSVTYPNIITKQFDIAIRQIFFKRNDMTTTQHVRMIESNVNEYVSLVRSIVINYINELNTSVTTIKSKLNYCMHFLDAVYSLFTAETYGKRVYESTSVFDHIYNKVSSLLCDLHIQYIAKGA